MSYLKKHYFDSIEEIPLWNWWKVTETGNLSYLRKDGDYKGKSPDLELWEQINDQYFNEYGINDNLKQLMKLKKKWIEKKTKLLVDDYRFALTEIDIIEAKMRELETPSSVKKEDTIIFLEERLGREIDPKKISVKKYYDYLNYYNG